MKNILYSSPFSFYWSLVIGHLSLTPMDSLFIRASTGEIKYLSMNEPARDTLVQMGEKAVPYLIGQLQTKDARERQTLIEILKKIKGPAVHPLMEYVEKDPNRESSFLAVHILGKIGEEARPAVPLMMGLVSHPKWRMRLAACEALGEIGDLRAVEPLEKALEDSVFLVRKGAVFGMVKIGNPQSIEALIRVLQDDSYTVRHPATEALVKFGKSSIPFLIKTLHERDPLSRSLACVALGKIGDPRVTKSLKRMLKDEDWGVRLSAGESLRNLGKKDFSITGSPIGQRFSSE